MKNKKAGKAIHQLTCLFVRYLSALSYGIQKLISGCALISVRVTMVATRGRNIMETPETALDENGNKVVILPDIIFSGKQNIDWNEVEKYLERFVGELVEVAETGDIIYPELFTAV